VNIYAYVWDIPLPENNFNQFVSKAQLNFPAFILSLQFLSKEIYLCNLWGDFYFLYLFETVVKI